MIGTRLRRLRPWVLVRHRQKCVLYSFCCSMPGALVPQPRSLCGPRRLPDEDAVRTIALYPPPYNSMGNPRISALRQIDSAFKTADKEDRNDCIEQCSIFTRHPADTCDYCQSCLRPSSKCRPARTPSAGQAHLPTSRQAPYHGLSQYFVY